MKDLVYSKLPQEVLNNCGGTTPEGSHDDQPSAVKSFLEKRLPRDDMANLDGELGKRFPLTKERQVFKRRVRRRGCPKNQTLSNSKKRALGLYNIERKSLLFKDLLPLHEMWKSYMEGYLDLSRFKGKWLTGGMSRNQTEEIGLLLYKADYHGALISVVRSTAPSLVGINGILVFETKNTLKLLGKDNITRCVPKAPCEFEILIGHLRIGFLGKNFLVKAPERSSKKLRGNKEFML